MSLTFASKIMKTPTAQNRWEEQPDEIAAQILATTVRKKARLKEIAEQSSLDFFIGGSLLATTVRIASLVVLGVLYFQSDSFSSSGVWPVLVLGGFIQALRANRRLDAILELQELEAEERLSEQASDGDA